MSAIRRNTARGNNASSESASGSGASAPSIDDGGRDKRGGGRGDMGGGRGNDAGRDSDASGDDTGTSQLVRLRILDKEVQLACQSGEEDELMQAAAYVNRAMLELRQRNTTSSIEKIAIVTAINTASSLLKARNRAGDDTAITERLARINRTLDNALTDDVGRKSPA